MPRNCYTLILAVGLTTLPGCLPSAHYPLQDLSYADRIRLDRQALGALANHDMDFGTYSNGIAADGTDSRLVSELYISNVSGARMSNLPLSNCLWLGTDAGGNAGDTLAMSWEAMASFLVEDEITPNPLRTCRLADELGAYTGVSAGSSSQALKGHSLQLASLNLGPGSQSDDLDFSGAILSAHREPLPTDPHGRCPVTADLYENDYTNKAEAVLAGRDFHFTTPAPSHVPQQSSYSCPDREDNSGETILCGKRCAYRHPLLGDAISLRLGFIDELDIKTGDLDLTLVPENRTARWMKPNLLMARGARTIARPMELVSSGTTHTYQWKTPTAGSPGDPTLLRWHENFSPSLLVAAVSFFRLEPGGVEVPLDDLDGDGISDIADNRVTLQQLGAFETCSGTADGAGRSFELAGCTTATPTYLHEFLRDVFDEPLTEPLAWQVTFTQDPLDGGSGEIYMKLELEVEFGEVGMQGRPLTVDLGGVPVGRRANDWVEIVSVGGPRLVVDQLSLQGPDASEFSFQLPINPRPVALPVDLVERDDSWMVALGEDFEALPLMERWEDAELQLAVARPLDFEGQVVNLYGDDAAMDDGLIVALDPDATFAPQLQQGVYRPAFRTAFDLQTLPVELSTGDRLRVRISALPQVYSTYPKSASLYVRAHPLTDPSNQLEINVALRLQTQWGPDAQVWPQSQMLFDGDSLYNALLDSVGDQPLLRTWIAIEGRDFSAFDLVSQNESTKVLQPGESEAFTLEYTHPNGAPCGPGVPLQEATLRLVTDAGDRLVELRGGMTCPP